jgi:hypothetical protein
VQVGDDDMRHGGAGQLYGFDAIGRFVDFAAAKSMQDRSYDPARERLVIDDKETYRG